MTWTRLDSKVINSKIPEIVRLYVKERLSSYAIAREIGIPPSTVRRKLKELGISRNHSEAEKVKRLNQARFTCRLCGKTKSIDELVLNKKCFPSIYSCKKCAGY